MQRSQERWFQVINWNYLNFLKSLATSGGFFLLKLGREVVVCVGVEYIQPSKGADGTSAAH